MSLSPLAETLRQALSELSLELAPGQQTRLTSLAEHVESWGRTTNLTGHKQAGAVMERLILDALALGGALPAYSTLADLGSGAGFPGLPLAIAYPERRFILVDARVRRHHFQRAMVRELELENVEPILGRIEDVPAIACDVALAQALAKPEKAAGWLRPWMAATGCLAIPGSEANPPALRSPASGQVTQYRVPVTGTVRSLWIGQIPL